MCICVFRRLPSRRSPICRLSLLDWLTTVRGLTQPNLGAYTLTAPLHIRGRIVTRQHVTLCN